MVHAFIKNEKGNRIFMERLAFFFFFFYKIPISFFFFFFFAIFDTEIAHEPTDMLLSFLKAVSVV